MAFALQGGFWALSRQLGTRTTTGRPAPARRLTPRRTDILRRTPTLAASPGDWPHRRADIRGRCVGAARTQCQPCPPLSAPSLVCQCALWLRPPCPGGPARWVRREEPPRTRRQCIAASRSPCDAPAAEGRIEPRPDRASPTTAWRHLKECSQATVIVRTIH